MLEGFKQAVSALTTAHFLFPAILLENRCKWLTLFKDPEEEEEEVEEVTEGRGTTGKRTRRGGASAAAFQLERVEKSVWKHLNPPKGPTSEEFGGGGIKGENGKTQRRRQADVKNEDDDNDNDKGKDAGSSVLSPSSSSPSVPSLMSGLLQRNPLVTMAFIDILDVYDVGHKDVKIKHREGVQKMSMFTVRTVSGIRPAFRSDFKVNVSIPVELHAAAMFLSCQPAFQKVNVDWVRQKVVKATAACSHDQASFHRFQDVFLRFLALLVFNGYLVLCEA
eukprot:jgi/Bigna1/91558/estExt_fgenesh1_pg.C_1060025